MNNNQIIDVLERYVEIYPLEAERIVDLQAQLEHGDVMNDRKTLPGHMTGAAIVLSPDKSKVLLVHHNIFQRWLQPGGHWDPGESDPLAAARREAFEETGVEIADYLPVDYEKPLVPIDIDSHPIAKNEKRQEEAHTHHDFRYVFVAASDELQPLETEVSQATWFNFDAPECESVRSILLKLTNVL